MATIIQKAKYSSISEKGASGIKEAILAGPATGSNRINLRKIHIEPNGKTSRKAFKQPVIYIILNGKILLFHDNGELDILKEDSVATLQKNEYHYLHNNGNKETLVLMIASQ